MTTEFKCPLCDAPMESYPGSRINKNDGVTLMCINQNCPCNENVFGHSNNEKNAYEIACLKYRKN